MKGVEKCGGGKAPTFQEGYGDRDEITTAPGFQDVLDVVR